MKVWFALMPTVPDIRPTVLIKKRKKRKYVFEYKPSPIFTDTDEFHLKSVVITCPAQVLGSWDFQPLIFN